MFREGRGWNASLLAKKFLTYAGHRSFGAILIMWVDAVLYGFMRFDAETGTNCSRGEAEVAEKTEVRRWRTDERVSSPQRLPASGGGDTLGVN